MHVIQYNLFEGCHEPGRRLNRLKEWLRTTKPDVIEFNELNGWNPDDFQNFTKDAGFSFCTLFEMNTSPFWIGLASKFPIHLLSRNEEDFHHGFLHIETNGVHFIVTHLSPADAIQREQEAAILADLGSKIKEPLLLMGDLNTLSPYDNEYYREHLDMLLTNQKLSKKFMKNRQINNRPMEILLNCGFNDIFACPEFQPTVPTTFNTDPMHALKLRLDYMLVNDALQDRIEKANVMVDPDTETISDHYPIECEW